MFSVSTVLGEKASDVEQSWGTSAKISGRRPPTHWTGRGQVNEVHCWSIFWTNLQIIGDVWWVERFFFVFFFYSVHGCMGMDVWMNVFTMPFLCADSGPWRKMSRACPAMSAITTSSGSTCPSQQESAWGAAKARQEKVTVEIVRKAIDVLKCCIMCWTHLQTFSVSTILGEASDVEQVPGFLPVAHRHIGQEDDK